MIPQEDVYERGQWIQRVIEADIEYLKISVVSIEVFSSDDCNMRLAESPLAIIIIKAQNEPQQFLRIIYRTESEFLDGEKLILCSRKT